MGKEMTIQQKFADARKVMSNALIERDGEVDVVLTALIAQENPLLIGPPGTAKSLLITNLLKWMEPSTKAYSIVFDKFTTPEALFGPISVKGLKEDIYRRITTGRLPEAHIAFGDEVFKGSTAILNTLLPILNERKFENGDGVFRKIPLLLFLSAANEFPQEANELGALFDRFLIRKKVKPIMTEDGEQRLILSRPSDFEVKYKALISIEEIQQATFEATGVEFSDDATEAFFAITKELRKEGIWPGDRRRVKSIKACQAFAYLNGSHKVETEHLEILAHTMWDDPQEQPEKCAKIVARVANPIGLLLTDIIFQVEDVMAKCLPTEAVPKLKEIQKNLESLEYTERVEKVDRYVSRSIKVMYNKVLGLKEGEEFNADVEK